MISYKSLSEQFLPNMYVENVFLDTELVPDSTINNRKQFGIMNSVSSNQTMTAGDTITSRILTSAKFVQTNTLNNDLTLLFDSITEETISIYIHQITDKSFYTDLVKSIYNNPVNTSLNSLPKETIDQFLKIYNTDKIKTVKRSFKQEFEKSKESFISAGTPNIKNASFQLPQKQLDDGTILNEIFVEAFFQGIPKNVDFLAYIVLSSIDNVSTVPNAPNIAPQVSGPYISNIRKEIVLLDDKIQDQALQFVIAPFPSNANQQALLKYGKPGDIWTGGVHFHNGRFMAGSYHSEKLHPYLDYSIVPNNRFIDNRIAEKVQRTIVNTTQISEELSSFVSMYKSNPLGKVFNKQKTQFISDMHLFHGPNEEVGKVNGMFFIDKRAIIENNSVFSFLFDKAKYFANDPFGQSAIKRILDFSTLTRCEVYDGSESLGSITQGQFEVAIASEKDNSVPKFYIRSENSESGVAPVIPGDTSKFEGMQCFSFKHFSTQEKTPPANYYNKEYSATVEYRDGTVEFVKGVLSQLKNMSKSINEVVTFLESKTGSKLPAVDYNTQRISGYYYTQLIQKGVVQSTPSGVYPKVFNQLLQSSVINDLILITRPIGTGDEQNTGGISQITEAAKQFRQYLKNLANLTTTKMTNLLQLRDFLNSITYSISNLLSDLGGAKPPKSTVLTSYGASQNNTSPTQVSTIKVKSKENKVTLYNYGYDFTGMIDVGEDDGSGPFIGRQKIGFLQIANSDYATMCGQLAAQVLEGGLDPDNPVQLNPAETFTTIGGVELSYVNSLYSFLCAPTFYDAEFKKFIYLPLGGKAASKQFKNSDFFNTQTAFTAIEKLKSNINEYNYNLSNVGAVLSKDLSSILNKQGTNIAKGSFLQAETAQDFFQQNTSAKDFSTELLDPSKNSIGLLGDKYGNQFKVSPEFTPSKSSIGEFNDSPKNNLLMSIVSAKNMSNAETGKMKTSFLAAGGKVFGSLQEAFQDPYYGPPVDPVNIPLQLLCFTTEIYDGEQTTSFKKYMSTNQGYISNGVVNPARLSQYFFTHQNIVRVEYLDGFKETTMKIPVNTTLNSQYAEPQLAEYEKTFRNLGQPIWKRLDAKSFSDIQATGNTKLCRLVMYTPEWSNEKLIQRFSLPLFNSYFKLQKVQS